MARIPIPPPMTAPPPPGASQVSINPPNSNIAQQIKDVVEQNARMFMDEWMKNNKDLFESKETKLRIQNVQSIVGMPYDDRLTITGVVEEDKYYQFFLDNVAGTGKYSILLHRRQTDSGHYIMEYDSKTLWLCTDEIDTIEKIIICMNTI